MSQEKKTTASAESEGAKDVEKTDEHSPDVFEANFKELKKWVDVKSSKYGTLSVIHERRRGRLGTALKVTFSMPFLVVL